MRNPERIDRVLYLIKQLWAKYPDLRFNQMISNLQWNYSSKNNDAYKEYSYSKWEQNDVVAFKKDVVSVDCFHLEDDKFETFLEEYLKENEVEKEGWKSFWEALTESKEGDILECEDYYANIVNNGDYTFMWEESWKVVTLSGEYLGFKWRIKTR